MADGLVVTIRWIIWCPPSQSLVYQPVFLFAHLSVCSYVCLSTRREITKMQMSNDVPRLIDVDMRHPSRRSNNPIPYFLGSKLQCDSIFPSKQTILKLHIRRFQYHLKQHSFAPHQAIYHEVVHYKVCL